MARKLFWGRAVLIFLSVLTLILCLKARTVVQVFLLALLLAYILDPLVKFLEKQKCPRLWGISLIYGLLLILLIFLGVWAIPVLSRQMAALGQLLPGYLNELKALSGQWQNFYQRLDLPDELKEVLGNWFTATKTAVWQFLRRFLNGIIPAISGSFIWLLAPIISFYFLKDKEELQKYVWKLLPLRYKKEEQAFLSELHATVTDFLRGTLLVSTIVGILTAAGLWLAGVNFALIFGLIAGICNIIPYFGPFIGAMPAVVFAFFQQPIKAFWTIVVMFVVQQSESHLITPKIMGDKLGLHPVVIMFALLTGGKIFGFWGLVLAVPMAGILKTVLKYLIAQAIYIRD